MELHSSKITMSSLSEYALIPISFEFDTILDLTTVENGLGGFVLAERKLTEPKSKDYDDLDPPTAWIDKFNVENWTMIIARSNGEICGGIILAVDCPELEKRKDVAVLWDIRVTPSARTKGVGKLLFKAGEQWASERSCRQLKIETQNINVRACKFYAQQGCTLGVINRFAYPALPDEIQMIWYKNI